MKLIANVLLIRKVYYSDWGDTPHIARADYNGGNIQVLRNIGLIFPNGLAEDFASKQNNVYIRS